MGRHDSNILDVTAIVLANICVSYIMTSQNEKAEELMRKIEQEEERVSFEDPDKQCFHLCIVNLVTIRHPLPARATAVIDCSFCR